MKPTNSNTKGCTPLSSGCVIWDGPNIPCINLCRGESVSDVVYDLATKLCSILKTLDISTYDLSCLELTSCGPADFHALIQLLIDKICQLSGVTPGSTTTNGCPNCVVNMAECFYYINPATGDQVTTNLLSDYVSLIGKTVCEILTKIGTHTGIITKNSSDILVLDTRVRTLESNKVVLPTVSSKYVLPGQQDASIQNMVSALDQQFGELRLATGTANDILTAAGSVDLNQAKSLENPASSMSSMRGWKNEVKSLSDSFANMWLTVTDVRNAVFNIQKYYVPTICSGISIKVTATLPNQNTIVVYPTGTIPSGLKQCNSNTTLFTIKDESGVSITVPIDIIANLNNSSGVPVTITNTGLNTSDNFNISATVCLSDLTTKSECQSLISFVLVNPLSCPSVNYIGGSSTINYSFYHSSGTTNYTLELYNDVATALIQSVTISASTAQTISGVFNGLTQGTTYKTRLKSEAHGNTMICPYSIVNTVPGNCPAPKTVTAIITINPVIIPPS